MAQNWQQQWGGMAAGMKAMQQQVKGATAGAGAAATWAQNGQAANGWDGSWDGGCEGAWDGGWEGGEQGWAGDGAWNQQSAQPQLPEVVDDGKTLYAFYNATGTDGTAATGTLVGTYKQEGVNHGRKYYMKQLVGKPGEIDVYLYYWDERDGPSLNGWWFGDTVGGQQVWGRNPDTNPSPPQSGWCIPWDGDVSPEFCLAGAKEKREYDAKVAKEQQRKMQIQMWQKRLNTCSDQVRNLETAAKPSFDVVEQIESGTATIQAIDAAMNQMRSGQMATVAAMKICIGEGKIIVQNAPELKDEMDAVTARLKTLQTQIKENSAKLMPARQAKLKEIEAEKKRAAEEARYKQLEPKQTERLRELVDGVGPALTLAEDEVEKVTIAAAPLEVEAGEDLESMMMEAVVETESRVKTAQEALTQAKNQLMAAAKEYAQFIPTVKAAATEQFTDIQNKYNEMMEKMKSFVNVRKDYQQRSKDKAALDDLSEKIIAIEVNIDQAESSPMDGPDAIKDIESALTSSKAKLNVFTQQVAKKLNELSKLGTGALREQGTEMQERIAQLRERVEKTMEHLNSMRSRLLAEALVQDAGRKVRAVEDGLTALAELILPESTDEQSMEEMRRTSNEAEVVATSVKTSLAEAQAFIAKKTAEAKKLAEETGGSVMEEIDALKSRLNQGRSQMEEFKSTLAERMRVSLLKEVEAGTAAAELDLQRLQEALSALQYRASEDPSSSELINVLSSAIEAEKNAKDSLVTAHDALTTKTVELKKLAGSTSSSSSELSTIQSRLTTVLQEIRKHQEEIQQMETRFRVKDLLSEFAEKAHVCESDVETAVTSGTSLLEQEEPAADAFQQVEATIKAADHKIKTSTKILDVKLRSAKGIFKEELELLHKRLEHAAEKLTGTTNSIKARQEQTQVNDIIAQAQQKVENAETTVQRAKEAHAPLTIESEEANIDTNAVIDALQAVLGECEGIVNAAHEYVNSQLSSGQAMTEQSSQRLSEEFSPLQVRLEEASTQFSELKYSLADFKRTNRSQMVSASLANVEAGVEKVKESLGKIDSEDQPELSEEDIRNLTEELKTNDREAQDALASAKEFVTSQLKEVRSLPTEERQEATQELSAMQTKLTQLSTELTKLSKQCAQSEQRFAAQGMLKEMGANVENLQKEAEVAITIGTPFMEKANHARFQGSMLLQDLVVGLEGFMSTSGMDLEALCAKVCQSAHGTKAEFTTFVGNLVSMTGNKELEFTEKQTSDMFSILASEVDHDGFERQKFLDLFLPRYVCTVQSQLWESQEATDELGDLNTGEVVRLFTSIEDDARVQCLLGRDGSKTWLSPTVLVNGEPASCLELSTTSAWEIDSVEALLGSVSTRCAQTIIQIDKDMAGVRTARDGPLAAVKAKLTQHRTIVSSAQTKVASLKKQVTGLKTVLVAEREKALKTVKEARMKENILSEMAKATKIVDEAEAKITQIIESLKSKDLSKDLSREELAAVRRKGEDAIQEANGTKEVVTKVLKMQEALPMSVRTALREVRLEGAKLNSRASTAERRCRSAIDPVAAAYEALVREEINKAAALFRAAFRRADCPAAKLFDEAVESGTSLSQVQFASLVAKLPDAGLSTEQISILFEDAVSADGIDRLSFSSLVEEYLACEKTVVMTKNFDLTTNMESVRKLEPGEIVQVIEGPKTDANDMKRSKCRAIRDGATGWISVLGNKGGVMMKPSKKPLVVCTRETAMMESFSSASKELHWLVPDEVFELLEGPREASLVPEMHLNGFVGKDKAFGWIMLSDSTGVIYAGLSSAFYKCVAATALTDSPDVNTCKAIRKIDVGELVEVTETEEKLPEDAANVQRLFVRAAKDGKTGWATVKGSRGTVFLEPDTQYKVQREIPLRQAQPSDAKVMRMLEAGETFNPAGAPKEVKPPALHGMHVRSDDGARSGWIVYGVGETAPLELKSQSK